MPEIDIRTNAATVLAGIDATGRRVAEALREAAKAAALLVHARARRYAPISPTQAQKNRMRKTNRKVHRKADATARAKPGGLTRSIGWAANADGTASVYVAANGEAGKYAVRIHDEKGVTWKKRGIGTVAKGPQADEKFIARAIADAGADIGKKTAILVGRAMGQ